MANPLDKNFNTSILVEAAGCNAVTFRAWRARNGLFPGTAGGRGWNRFSAIDVSVVRTVVVMTKHGIPASGAISFAQKYLTAFFDNIWTAPEENAFCTFEMSLDGQEALFSIPPSDWSIQDVMANSTGIATVLSLRQIVEHVRPLLTAPQKG